MRNPRTLAPAGLLAVLAVVLLVVPAPPADAATDLPVDLSYRVHDLDRDDGTVRVTFTVDGHDGKVRSFTFLQSTHPYPVRYVSSSGATFTNDSGSWKLELEQDPATLTYEVNVRRPGFEAGQWNAYLGPDWGLFKAEALGMGYSVSFDGDITPVWTTDVRFDLPDGWNAEGPWPRTDGGGFALPAGDALPKGFVTVGNVTTVTHEGPWKTYRYVRLGSEVAYRSDLFGVLEASTPYLSAVYGNHTGEVLLAVSAPDPMFEGGLGGWNSLFVHEDSDLEILAHEHVHVWQRFRALESVGSSSLWIVEGDADLHGPLSLVATEYWSPAEADDHFRTTRDRAEREGVLAVPLDEATYRHERSTAYDKGALVLHWLDGAMRNATDGRASVADLVRELNERRSPVAPDWEDQQQAGTTKVTNAFVEDVVRDLLEGADAAPGDVDAVLDGLERFVTTDAAPGFTSVRAREDVVLEDLRFQPPVGQPGDPSHVLVTARNPGATSSSRTVELRVNGTLAASRDVTLDPGAVRRLDLGQLPDLPLGEHPVRVAYLDATYRVVRPADPQLDRVSLLPDQPRQGSTLEVVASITNRGGAPANVTVHVLLDGADAGATTATVPGELTRSLSVRTDLQRAGTHLVTVNVTSDGQVVDVVEQVVNVVGDRDGDGVPDDEDDYPDDPRYTERTPVTEVLRTVPGPSAGAAVGVLASVALIGMRRRRGG